MEYSKGPWIVDTSEKHVQVYSEIGTLIVDRVARRERQVDNDDAKFSRLELANALLIAAAPDLLEALEKLLDHVTVDSLRTNWEDVIKLTTSAIKRAKGL